MRLQGCPNGILKFSSYFRDNTMSMYPKINTLLLLTKIIDANSENLKKNTWTVFIPVTLQQLI